MSLLHSVSFAAIFSLVPVVSGRTAARIKGGEVVTKDSRLSFPHHVQLALHGRDDFIQVFCGGTLIAER